MSSSEERVGGVEPETVTGCGAWIQSYGMEPGKCGEVGVCVTCWEKREGLHVPTLQARLALVEEELRDWETTAKCSSDALRECEEELRQAREVAAKMKAHYEEALSNRDRAIASIRADRDRLAAALRKIAGQEPVKNALHPQWGAAHIAEAALSPVQGEHEQDGDTA